MSVHPCAHRLPAPGSGDISVTGTLRTTTKSSQPGVFTARATGQRPSSLIRTKSRTFPIFTKA